MGDVLSVLENIFLFGTFPANSGSGLNLMVLSVNGSWLMFSMWAVVLQHPIRSTGRICIYDHWKNFPLIDQYTQETEELTKVLALTHLMACVLSRDSQHSLTILCREISLIFKNILCCEVGVLCIEKLEWKC